MGSRNYTQKYHNCHHDQDTGNGLIESFHKIKELAKSFRVVEMTILDRIRKHDLPHEKITEGAAEGHPWIFVSDEHLRAWYASGEVIGDSERMVARGDRNALGTLQLACGHVVERVPALGVATGAGSTAEGLARQCDHSDLPALHGLLIIAMTYDVSVSAVQAKIVPMRLPVHRVGTRVYVSDGDLRGWIAEGITFGNGASTFTPDASSTPSVRSGTLKLACGHMVRGVKPPKPPKFLGNLRKCKHGCEYPGGPYHSVDVLARAVGANITTIFNKLGEGNRVRHVINAQAYGTDEQARTILGIAPGTRLACGYVLPVLEGKAADPSEVVTGDEG